MAAGRLRRAIRELNYALFNNTGKKFANMADEIEDGQIADSPFRIHNDEDDDDFHTGSVNSQALELDQQGVLEDTLVEEGDSDSVQKFIEESVLSLNNTDIMQDDVWDRQQDILKVNREKCEQLRIQLERRKKLNEALLRAEQDRRELAQMKRHVLELETRRSVKNVPMRDDKIGGKHGGVTDNRVPHAKVPGRDCALKVTYGDELASYDPRFEQGTVNPLRGKDKVNKWLASNEDLAAIHETRSEPGKGNKNVLSLKYGYRKAMTKEQKAESMAQPRRAQAGQTPMMHKGSGACPKYSQD